MNINRRWVCFGDLHREPFRVFFPCATLAGLIGVALWPVLLLGWLENYPGPSHARLMVQGFFAGFIFGFMGTAIPRLIGAAPFSARETVSLLALFLGNVTANTVGMNTLADVLFVVELAYLFRLLKHRCHAGKSEPPPPSFVLVGLAFASALVGTGLQLAGRHWVLNPPLDLLARLLSYHALVLLAVLGAGGFLLPRFLGLGTRRNVSECATKTPEWICAARFAKITGALLLATYVAEALGWSRASGTARSMIIVGYLFREMPLERWRWDWRGVHWQLSLGLLCLPLGVFAAGWFPSMRIPLMHVELVGGFALVTFSVATRVVFGHSGARQKLKQFNPWLTSAALLMLLGLVSRIFGDVVPGIQTTHYNYGAACWMAGVAVWAGCVLPRVLRPDPE